MSLAHPNPLFLVLLFLHIGGAILAFGPTFAFPLLSAAAAREPQHLPFMVRATEFVSKRLVTPVAIFVGLTGILLIGASGRSPGELWLTVAIALYFLALGIALFVAGPNTAKLVEATRNAPPPPAPGEERPAGPPPHIAPLVARAKRYGQILGMLVVVILLLMVFKPTL